MTGNDITTGNVYVIRISTGRFVAVKVTGAVDSPNYRNGQRTGGVRTSWDVKEVEDGLGKYSGVVRSAAKFRRAFDPVKDKNLLKPKPLSVPAANQFRDHARDQKAATEHALAASHAAKLEAVFADLMKQRTLEDALGTLTDKCCRGTFNANDHDKLHARVIDAWDKRRKANAVGSDVPTPTGNIHTPNGYAASMKATDDLTPTAPCLPGSVTTAPPPAANHRCPSDYCHITLGVKLVDDRCPQCGKWGTHVPADDPRRKNCGGVETPPAPTNGVEATVKPRPAWVPMNKIHEHARVTSMELDFMGRVAAWVKHRGDTLVSIARHPSDAGRVFVVRVVNPDQKLWDHLVACDYTGVNPVESRYIGG